MAFDNPCASVTQISKLDWVLDREMVYRGNRESWTVPVGFVTDLASVPRMAAWLIPRYGTYTPAAILHDYLWRERPVSKADADGLFRRCLGELGVSWPKRWMMWTAVRAAGGLSGASARDLAMFVLVFVPAVLFMAIPAIVVQVFLVAFWLIELVAFAFGKLTGRPAAPPAFPTRV
jgi:hypothetical protein